MSTAGLQRLSSDELKRLLRALHRGALPSPVTRSALIEKGFGDVELHLGSIAGRDVESAKAILVAVLAERAATPGSTLELVYMGAPAPGTRSRDMLEQVRELLTSAVQRVELYGLVGLDAATGLLRTAAAVCEGRGLPTRLVFDTARGGADAQRVRELVISLFRERSQLEVWISPQLQFAARALIIDGSRALVTSGELHGLEQDLRIDLGVRLRDAAYIASFHAEWERLVRLGAVIPLDLA